MGTPKPRDLFPGALEMMVLRLLEQEPAHGYALVQRIKQVSNDLLQVEEGSRPQASGRRSLQLRTNAQGHQPRTRRG